MINSGLFRYFYFRIKRKSNDLSKNVIEFQVKGTQVEISGTGEKKLIIRNLSAISVTAFDFKYLAALRNLF